MVNGNEMLAIVSKEKIDTEYLSVTKFLEKSLNEKVDELLRLQKKITKDLEKIIDKLSV